MGEKNFLKNIDIFSQNDEIMSLTVPSMYIFSYIVSYLNPVYFGFPNFTSETIKAM
jgi:hypothetical protein